MNWFYLLCSGVFTLTGILLTVQPLWGKRLVQFIVNKQLQILPGTVEIALGLGTLYYREQTRLEWFVYTVGLLLFIDGVLYMLSARRLQDFGSYFATLNAQAWRSYGFFILLLAFGYLLTALR